MGKKIVVYHNNFTEAIYPLGVMAKKIMLAVILNRDSNGVARIHRSTLKELVGVDPTVSHHSAKAAVDELMRAIITIQEVESNGWRKYQLLTEVSYVDGFFGAKIPKAMLPYFDDARKKLFTRYHVENVKPLQSSYSIKMYELLKQYQKIGRREFTVEELRKRLDCTEKYIRFTDFKSNAIEVAQKDLKQTDITFTCDYIKLGRNVVKVVFKIKSSKKVKKKQPKAKVDFEVDDGSSLVGERIYYESGNEILDGTVVACFAQGRDGVIKVETKDKGTASVKVPGGIAGARSWVEAQIYS